MKKTESVLRELGIFFAVMQEEAQFRASDVGGRKAADPGSTGGLLCEKAQHPLQREVAHDEQHH